MTGQGIEDIPSFNPHSSFRPSATSAGIGQPTPMVGFNPHSSFRPSATCCAFLGHSGQSRFNPHSSFRPSATVVGVLGGLAVGEFQSSLELSPECNGGAGCGDGRSDHTVSILTRAFARVQLDMGHSPAWLTQFQSSLELSPECNFVVVVGNLALAQVSILTRAFARVQPSAPALRICSLARFNPHSSFRPSATCRVG